MIHPARVAISLLIWGASLPAVAGMSQNYPYQRCFEVAAGLHDVPLDLLLAVAATESNWDADARSHANAHGIMQIQWPGTARHLGVKRVGELYNPCLNINLGAQYLKELLHTFDASETAALAAYNYGPTRIKAASEIPAGAQQYAARVMQHRQRIKQGLVPAALQPSSRRSLVVFDSRVRADRLAKKLSNKIEGATVQVERTRRPVRGYAVILAVGQGGLTVADHVMLKNMGWDL